MLELLIGGFFALKYNLSRKVRGVVVANQDDYMRESKRLEQERQREAAAREKAYDMHGGDFPSPVEPPMPTIIAQFGEWAVTPYGVECLVYPYQIQWDSIVDSMVDDDYWLRYLAVKEWVNLTDFANALRRGREIHHYIQNIASTD